jgi:hypothetical protein
LTLARNPNRLAYVFGIEMHSLDTQDGRSRRIRGRNTLLAGCGATVMVFLLAGFAYLAWANVLPPPERDHRILPSPNGYDVCAAALANLQAAPSTGNPWDSDLQTLRADIAQARPSLAALSAAVRLPYLSPARDPNSSWQFAQYREASRQLVGQARVELADGRPGLAMEWTLDAIELGAKMGRGGPLIDSLVGIACASIGQNGSERCVSQLAQAEAHAAGRRLDGILAQLPAATEVIDEERRYSLASARDTFAGRVPIASSPAQLGAPVTWLDRIKERVLLLVYPKSWGYQQVDRYWRALEAELRKPYSQRKPPPSSPPEWDPVLGGAGLDLHSIQLSLVRPPANLRLLRVELALREYHQQHDAYPATLQQLVPGELAAVPIDPFSEQPLRYRREGAAYVLYSVGPDLKDDHGTPIASSRSISVSSTGDLVAGKLFPSQTRTVPPPPR